MKIVFFDVDKLTGQYLKTRPACKCNIILLENSIETMTDEQYEQIKDAAVISVFVHSSEVMGEKLLSKFPSLKLIATRSTGYDHIDLNYCKSRGINVVNVPKYGEATVAEYTLGLLLNVSRKIITARNDMFDGVYKVKRYTGFDLYGRTIGIIGTGAIGRHVIKLAKGFGMNVLAYDLYPNEEFQRIYNINYVSLDELYAGSDVISLHAPSTKENYHLLNDGAFSKMKDGVIIINTARGDLIDGEALYRNILSGKVGGAGLDVLENEDFIIHDDIMLEQENMNMNFAINTIVNAKLLKHKNVIVTPHVAFNSADAVHRILETTIKNIESFADGKLINSVIK
jgi:D-lactate dehydrogenase